jgi:hypothetical protein
MGAASLAPQHAPLLIVCPILHPKVSLVSWLLLAITCRQDTNVLGSSSSGLVSPLFPYQWNPTRANFGLLKLAVSSITLSSPFFFCRHTNEEHQKHMLSQLALYVGIPHRILGSSSLCSPLQLHTLLHFCGVTQAAVSWQKKTS